MDIKVVVITGAGSGLGASLAKKYSELGAHVCLLGRTKSKLDQTAETLTQSHSIYEVDVTSKSEVAKVMQSIKEAVGPVDLLINNAGVGAFDLSENIGEESVHNMIDINLKGTIFCTQEVLPDMKQRNQGLIVNVVSTAGVEGKVNETVYCASKFGVRGFTESLAIELRDTEIRVLGAYMGGMKSPFWDGIYEPEQTKHLMDPDDVADIIIENTKPRASLSVTEVIIKNKI
ncbi:SDR family oxidoreductase [Neobacillus mesonae]|uniref:SDR family oxidoreductase n=1 Tax=Neobacillus mesonae TaxID=1193713 RepID=UPI00082A5BEC|nr:SDR family oxidoreductase [Neobacillus mesonae]MED4203531.1 SDR family NAD(P)-dependent oxidoreductase [Neobacillus mesonae]